MSNQVIIYVHGLGGTMFWPKLVFQFVNAKTSVLTFNNRGHDKMSSLKRLDKKGKIHKILAGSAHEVFTDCADDIAGAVNFCKKQGFKKIILVGHSTGCQKSVYYLVKTKNQKQIAKVILLCPISDYAAEIKFNRKMVDQAAIVARRLVKAGQSNQLLPSTVWAGRHDAQRFLSLFTPDSQEEIFCYATLSRRPTTLQKINMPMLLVFAEKDEFMDRPLSELVGWFKEKLVNQSADIKIIKGANHGFVGRERAVIKMMNVV